MIDHNNETYVIFASHIPDYAVRQTLADASVPFKPLQGVYKGKKERSYIVNEKDMFKVVMEGLVSNEESVLLLKGMQENGRPAELIYKKDLSHEPIGFFKEATKEYAMQQDNYTHDPVSGAYYVAE